MIKRILLLALCGSLAMSCFAQVPRTYDKTAYAACKERAETKKSSILSQARKEYRDKSAILNEKTKRKLDAAGWYMSSSFKLESKKILAEKDSAYKMLDDSMKEVRKGVDETYKVELALCEFNFLKSDKTKKAK